MSEGPNRFSSERKRYIDDRNSGGSLYSGSEQVSEGRMKSEAEDIKPALLDFFRHVVKDEPDYIVLLDKGARPFGVPFEKFLHELRLRKEPKVVFWNIGEFKYNVREGGAVPIPPEYQARPELHGKKLFFVDETYAHGTGARTIRDFLNTTGEQGAYFAFTSAEREIAMPYDEEIPERGLDERFHIYDIPPIDGIEFFTKRVARGYVMDSVRDKEHKDEPNRTQARFVRTDDVSHKDIYGYDGPRAQAEVEDVRERAMDQKKMSDKMLYDVLESLDKTELLPEERT